MLKKGWVYIGIGLFTIALLLVLQYNRPKRLNWFPSYVAEHRIPYGCKVFTDVVDDFFPDNQQIDIPPYERLTQDQEHAGTYFFANDYVSFEDAEREALLDWTAKGNTLFVASGSFEQALMDTLGITTKNLYNNLNDTLGFEHRLVHPKLSPDMGYVYTKDDFVTYFDEMDAKTTTILGTVDDRSDPSDETYANVIRLKYKGGTVILSTFPKAVTNYFMLSNENYRYTEGLLSYIDTEGDLLMDAYHKNGKAFYTSPMYIFLNEPSLKWAYYLCLIGSISYILFEGKRKQRAIPVVLPLKNQTLAFTRTIADMYYEKGEHKQIAKHKIAYFLEYIRTRFYMNTHDREATFYDNLAARSAHDSKEIKELFSLFDQIERQSAITADELKKVNTAIEEFKKRAHGRN
ncbi:DUF4350 domain-containing protein [Maribacter sp. 2-571]|uniref:DUF4350 domain-containing protein n=1 Tax=Maribacter sp. 2-571 TaxID=3417569 RepID=UPI003D338280